MPYAEDAGKAKNVKDLEGFLKNSGQFICSGQTRDMNNSHNTKTVVDHSRLL